MIQSIDGSTLCGHLKALLHDVVPNDMLQAWIGRLNNLDPETFNSVAKDLGHVMTNAFQGNYLIPPEDIPHLAVSTETTTRLDRDGKPVEGTLFKDKVLNMILSLDPREPRTEFIVTGLTNLKSACVITRLSRSEKDESYSSIAHTTSIDSELVQEWTKFVNDFTPYLINRIRPVPKQRYTPLWLVPSGDTSTCYLNEQGVVQKAKKGEICTMDFYNFKHPVVNRIARKYPDEFASAVLIGYPVIGAKFDLPKPYDGEIPIGKIAISPKRAQKPRIVFESLAILDSMSRPAFYAITSLYRWNIQGVESHNEARLAVQRMLKNIQDQPNAEIWSFDQSAFTDNFDYNRIQRPIAVALRNNGLLSDYDIDVIDSLNNGLWDASYLRPNKVLRFGTGTGMGTPPSFPLASIGNGYLYAFAYWRVKGKYPDPHPKSPCMAQVVGDDMCIADTLVAHEYLRICESIGLKINMTKTMHSHHVAEFCGKMITTDHIYDKRKLIDLTSYSGLIETIDYYQTDMDHYLDYYPQFRPIVERLAMIPRPFGTGKELNLRSHEPIDSMTKPEVVTLSKLQLSSMRNFRRQDAVPGRSEFLELDERLLHLPTTTYDQDISMPDDDVTQHDKPSHYDKAIIDNAFDVYRRADVATWNELLQAARIIDSIYGEVYDRHPDALERGTMDLMEPSLARRKPGKDREETYRLLFDVTKMPSKQNGKEEDSYEFI